MGKELFEIKELELCDQRDINGGNPLAVIAVLGAVIYLYNNKEDLIKGIIEGYESVRK